MTQDDELPGGLHYDGSARDVQVGPMTGIVRYYPVPSTPPVTGGRWWRHCALFLAGVLVGVLVAAVVL